MRTDIKRLQLYTTCAILLVQCSKGPVNGGLFIPDDFEATVVVDSIVETVRHLAVSPDGYLYAKLRNSGKAGSIAALQDKDNDGQADVIEKFGAYGRLDKWSYATALRTYNGFLYHSSDLVVYRYKLKPGTLIPEGEMEIILTDDHEHGKHEHIGKPLAFDNKGNMYVPFGAPSNACQEPKRTPRAPGLDPCPQLENHGGIWRFDANKTGQTQKDGYRYASGIRSVVAMDWNAEDEQLYVVMHGRDDLLRLFPNIYSPWQSAILPSEEFMKVTEGSNFGWPYCYYDQVEQKKVLAPEYGGNGKVIGRCAEYADPLMGFPGHWAPNDLVFYNREQFPARYKNGAFIAFHGSTNRAPYPQAGYFVCFVPFRNGKPTGEWEVFADGFAGKDPIMNVNDAIYRPMGIAVGPDGSLYISDSVKGKIWKVSYTGDKAEFGPEQLASMETRKKLPHIRTPDEVTDKLMKEDLSGGEAIYSTFCSACHQGDGTGASGRFPPLAGTEWVSGDTDRLISILLKGMDEAIEVNGEQYSGVMPQHAFLSDSEIAAVLTYIRSNFGNSAAAVTATEVSTVRKAASDNIQ